MEESKKNKKKWILILILFLLLIIGLLLSLNFKNNSKKYIVSFDTVGGSSISDLEVVENSKLKLPKDPVKEGYVFGGFELTDGSIATDDLIITNDIKLKAIWLDKTKTIVNVTFVLDNGKKIDVNEIDGEKIQFISPPTKSGYVFAGWILDSGEVIDGNNVVNSGMVIKPRWISQKDEKITITVNSDGGNTVDNIIIAKGDKIKLPQNPTKKGYIFGGWKLSDGTTITKDTKIDSNVTIIAIWKDLYVCPKDCTPSSDNKTCTKNITTDLTTRNTCSSGSTLKNGKCLNYSKKYHATNDYGNWKCQNKSDYMYTEEDGMGGAFMWCVPTSTTKKSKSCPSGYKEKDSKCVKTETINCTENK